MMKPEEKEAIKAAVAGALEDAQFASLTVEAGFDTDVVDGIKVALQQNGTLTITVEINGGAKDMDRIDRVARACGRTREEQEAREAADALLVAAQR